MSFQYEEKRTRKQRTAELLKRLEQGPSLSMGTTPEQRERFATDYRLWVTTWILPDLTGVGGSALIKEADGVTTSFMTSKPASEEHLRGITEQVHTNKKEGGAA